MIMMMTMTTMTMMTTMTTMTTMPTMTTMTTMILVEVMVSKTTMGFWRSLKNDNIRLSGITWQIHGKVQTVTLPVYREVGTGALCCGTVQPGRASCSVEGVHISPSLWQFEWGCYCSRYWLFFHFPPHLIYPEIKCCKHATWVRTLPLSHCQGERGDGWTLSFRAAEGHTLRPVWRLRHVTWVEVDSRGKLCGSISSDRN